MRHLLASALTLAPALAVADGMGAPVRNPCASGSGGDICVEAMLLAQSMQPNLPRELAPGLPIVGARHEGATLVLVLAPPPDGPTPDATTAAAACADPALRHLVRAGGRVRLDEGAQSLVEITACPETP